MDPVKPVDHNVIREMLKQKKNMEILLSVCASCGMCAESCFLYVNEGKDPSYMPSYKAVHSLGQDVPEKGQGKPRGIGRNEGSDLE